MSDPAWPRASDHQLYNQLLFEALRYGKIHEGPEWRTKFTAPGLLVTNAEVLYDQAAERLTALDLLISKRMIQEG